MAQVISFNSTIAVTGTTQALDPSGAEFLPAFATLTIHALGANTATLYISNKPGSGAGVGFPLEKGLSITVQNQTTGLYITGTANDVYGVIGS